jgi:hypothetical protein
MSCFFTPFFKYLYFPCYSFLPCFCLSFMLRYSFAQCVGDSLLQVWSLGGSLETISSKLVEAISFSPYFCWNVLLVFLPIIISRFCAIKEILVRPCCFGGQKSSLSSICWKHLVETSHNAFLLKSCVSIKKMFSQEVFADLVEKVK